MFGRPVHLLAAAGIVAAASVASAGTAFAGCFSGCGSYTYAAPVAYYSAPVVYSYSYAAPVAYAAPCNPCGGYGHGYGYAASSAPMYVVNQGPAFTEPVGINAEPTPAPQVSYGYGNDYPWYGAGYRRYGAYGYGYRGGYRAGYRRYGFRGYRHFGYRGLGYRDLRFRGFGHQRYRYGAVVPGMRFGMRHPVGPVFNRGMHRMPGVVQPMHHMMGMQQHRIGGMAPRHPTPMMKKKP